MVAQHKSAKVTRSGQREGDRGRRTCSAGGDSGDCAGSSGRIGARVDTTRSVPPPPPLRSLASPPFFCTPVPSCSSSLLLLASSCFRLAVLAMNSPMRLSPSLVMRLSSVWEPAVPSPPPSSSPWFSLDATPCVSICSSLRIL